METCQTKPTLSREQWTINGYSAMSGEANNKESNISALFTFFEQLVMSGKLFKSIKEI